LPMRGIIYKARNKITRKLYVGQTTLTLEKRIQGHVGRVMRGSTSYFHNSLRKYGLQSFVFSVLDEASSQKVLDEKECYWIKHFRTLAPRGYNLRSGGEHVWFSPEGLKKVGEAARRANTGRVPTKEQREKQSKAMKGRPKPPFTEEHLRNLSISHKGQKVSKERRMIASRVHTGRIKSGEECQNNSLAMKKRWEDWRALPPSKRPALGSYPAQSKLVN
jgi:group I intron endonuclease